jgi:MoaA/NifB/PqqE/SkfB family radical SAM enzyme
MRRRDWSGAPERRTLREVLDRRLGWFVGGLTPRKLTNVVTGLAQYAAKAEVLRSWPVVLKIDISPCCNLRCPTCVHADPSRDPRLADQSFRPDQRMSVADFEQIVHEIGAKSSAVSLYYLGDPLMHPDLCEMCGIARRSGLNVHISTSFSFRLSDGQVREIVNSGLTHLSVCVDGLSQESYERTRAGGRIAWVLSNLERACAYREQGGRGRPRIEVQYIKYRHNADELETASALFDSMGVDDVVTFWGTLHNYVDCDPGTYEVGAPKKRRFLPRCYWPYLFMVIKYDGSVIPCCNHRIGEQYRARGEPRALGNVLAEGVHAVWNAPGYRALRRFVCDPELALADRGLAASFCAECPRIFRTTRELNLRSAEHYTFEEIYAAGAVGGEAPREGTAEA